MTDSRDAALGLFGIGCSLLLGVILGASIVLIILFANSTL